MRLRLLQNILADTTQFANGKIWLKMSPSRYDLCNILFYMIEYALHHVRNTSTKGGISKWTSVIGLSQFSDSRENVPTFS